MHGAQELMYKSWGTGDNVLENFHLQQNFSLQDSTSSWDMEQVNFLRDEALPAPEHGDLFRFYCVILIQGH